MCYNIDIQKDVIQKMINLIGQNNGLCPIKTSLKQKFLKKIV